MVFLNVDAILFSKTEENLCLYTAANTNFYKIKPYTFVWAFIHRPRMVYFFIMHITVALSYSHLPVSLCITYVQYYVHGIIYIHIKVILDAFSLFPEWRNTIKYNYYRSTEGGNVKFFSNIFILIMTQFVFTTQFLKYAYIPVLLELIH
jgi:hypothetical protein